MRRIGLMIAGIGFLTLVPVLVKEYVEDIKRTDIWETLACIGGLLIATGTGLALIMWG